MHVRKPRSLFLAGTTAAIMTGRAGADDSFTLRMGVGEPAASVLGITSLQFAQAVNRRSNGKLKIEVYPSGQLAREQATIDGLVSGTVDFAIQSTSYLIPLVPQYEALDMPFLFRDSKVAFRVLDGAIGDNLGGLTAAKGIIIYGWGTPGFKQIETTTRAVSVLQDMKGLRIRIQAGAAFAATYQALGAVPVTIDLAETFTALSQNAIDGIDINLDSATKGKYYTVIKHVALSNHVCSIIPLMGSKRRSKPCLPSFSRFSRKRRRASYPRGGR